ncbi:Uncharacterised protein [Enterobacter hormaechei]|nr:hypothetical protein DJ546_03225 [Enterobacter hormaechei]TYF57442.1 hypothetical protein DJ547_04750 [Enterobacter hormaechei]CZU72578.1 Uncharacterised protein [Enterobacter hormaechei]CZW59589.1 Uncharacterised protein [Enterobacter hormaechei]CZX32609.1 Uncharacterised protein [Enterobacter hormaechei]
MNARKHALTWVVETLMLFIIYSLVCYIMPDVLLYHLYTRHFGFVTELEWSGSYTLLLFIFSFLLNAVLIYLWALRK